MSENLSSNAEAQGDDGYESLASVEFAGEKQGKIQESEHATGEHLTLEEKVKRLRVPFEEDQEVKTLVLQRVDELQSEIAARLEELSSLEEAIHTKRAELESISDSFELRSGKFISRVRSRFGITDKIMENLKTRKLNIEQQIAGLKKRIEEIKSLNSATETTIRELNSEPDYETKPRLFTPGEKEEILDYDALSELSLEEYIALWRRLNPFYATHTTRQGIRDHIGMYWHSEGKGKYYSGFIDVLKQGKIMHSPAEVRFGIHEGFTEEDVLHCVEHLIENHARLKRGKLFAEDGIPIEEQASQLIDIGPFHDRLACHFGLNVCLNRYYGAEDNNEVFFLYPVDILASQSRFGKIERFSKLDEDNGNEKFSDLHIWADQGRIPLDAGIVFLPKSVIVSPETGSTYELSRTITETGKELFEPVTDEDAIASLTNAMLSLIKEYGDAKFRELMRAESTKKAILDRMRLEFDVPDRIIAFINSLTNMNGEGPIHFTTGSGNFEADAIEHGIDHTLLTDEEKTILDIRFFLEYNMLHLKKVESGIPAEEYWRSYFERHPLEEPKHIVFYDGDPSLAVRSFLEKNHIATFNQFGKKHTIITGPGDTTESDGNFLGFDSHYVSSYESFEQEQNRFKSIALPLAIRMIRAYFHNQEEQSK